MEVRSGYKQTEVGTIPADWEVRSIDQIGLIKTGPFGTLLKASEYSGNEGVPLISVAEVGDGGFRVTHHTPCVPEIVVRRLPQYVLRTGDIVFGRKGAVERSALVSEHENGWFLGSDGISVRPLSSCHPPYLAAQFRSDALKSWLIQNAIGTTMASLNQRILSRVLVPYAPLPEQHAIAAALSDVDALLGGLERLIAKKRDLKQAAMQQLLTGQTRLPGFDGEWEMKRLGDCLLSRPDYGINAAAVPYSDKLPSYIRITDISEHGHFWPDPCVSVDASSADQYYLKEGDVVFARTGASVGKSYLYSPRDGELVFAGFLIRVRPNPELLVPAYLAAYATTKPYWNWVRLMSMRSGQPGINGNEYSQLPMSLPSLPEQTAIAAVLSDMDAELSALEARRDKTRALKQGMMQELLTGRIRLVAASSNVVTVDFATKPKPAPSDPKSHNWQFNEAVVVAMLVKQFGSEQYPLGRKRCTKLGYLMHRHVERAAQGYLKKAAGPYNPAIKYKGPETIAQKNGYIRPHTSGKFSGFVAAEKIAEAEDYFDKWYGREVLAWLEQFRHQTNDELELLATVDMAITDVKRVHGEANVAAVKSIILDHPEWETKLEREIFSDTNIARAIGRVTELFTE